VQRGLRLKKAGNAIVTVLGGREIHPINVRVGGFYRTPTRAELVALLPELRRARDDAREALRWTSTFAFPDVTRDYELVALRHPDEYPILDGRVVSSRGLDLDVHDYDAHFVEAQAPWSNALRSTIRGRGSYLCGPLARFNLSFDRLLPEVQELAHAVGLVVPCTNPFRSILVRMLEIVQALEEAIRIIEDYEVPSEPAVVPAIRAGTGYGATEAPRGLLYHRYTIDDEGTIVEAQIVAPTSQNQLSIEGDLHAIAGELAAMPHAEATLLAERSVRNHDPCISCATHFLTLNIEAT
jgi:coenzyme F420-reducing hydrogenase alpha subunit